jgi:cyclopropane fatty-acyl-phospholipid synthase-like methyltransferase
MITKNDIDNGKAFDWGKASTDYAKYRDIYPEEFYERLIRLGLCAEGQRVLDLGTGTGVLPRSMYKYGAKFTGTDISENQIREAVRMSLEAGMEIDYVTVSAEDVQFPDASFDVITACQCFMYFNKAVALPNIHRLLTDNGRFVILFMSYLPGENEIARKSEELILKYNPSWSGAGLNRQKPEMPDWLGDLFEVNNLILYDLNVPFTRESWHGRMKACRGIGASLLTPDEIASWEKEHRDYLSTMPESFRILHQTSIIDLRKRP